ncbi:MAG TPA: type IV toxin-antitoxin system AbiEi family antitoxin domain-containing protein [Solirubrobacteraceae bacterium]|nr:type IV toxin-antitoxin system AbiEi family antitoxin domain-containing protein [Solirubrobacteraceae bacterium]
MAPRSARQRPTQSDPDPLRGVSRGERCQRPGAVGGEIEWDVGAIEGWPDRRIGEIASAQKSLITRRQLLALGAGRDMVDRALARGRLHSMHRGIYALVPFPALGPLATELAAVLACGDAALLSHHSAAATWGLRPSFIGDVEVIVVGADCGRNRAGIRVHRVEWLDPRDIRRYRGIPITSPARALLDIAPDLSDRELERALDEALIKRLTSHAAINAVLNAYSHRRGVARLRALADPGRPTTDTRSGGEEALLALIRKTDMPAPELNARVGHYTADFVWREQKVIVELDGYDYHRGRAAFERDHERDAEHQRMGYLVIRVTGRQLAREPEAILVRIATALAARRAAA